MSGGGGGDGGAAKRQAQLEAKKQQARDALNAVFGEESASLAAPTREQFTLYSGKGLGRSVTEAEREANPWVRLFTNGAEQQPFDQAGYDAAMAAYEAQKNAPSAAKQAREQRYTDIRSNAYTAGLRGLDEQNADAKRNTKFALFAQGLNGGSADIDEAARLKRVYDNGILQLGAKADAAAADARADDESTRLSLLQSIDAGMDQGSALSSALAQQKVNSDRAAASAAQTSVDDLFGNAGLLYQQSIAARGKQRAVDQYPDLFGASGSANKTKTASGIVTPTY